MRTKIFFMAGLLLLAASCKTTKTIAPKQQPVVAETRQVDVLIEKVKKQQPSFGTANVSKMTIEIKVGEREMKVSASCKVKKDSLIQISIQPFLGVEMFKADLAKDSIRLFDKMNRRYYVVDYGFLKEKFGVEVTFKSVQALIFNQFFTLDANTEACVLNPSPVSKYRIDHKTALLTQSTDIAEDYSIRQVTLAANDSPYQMQLNYDNFVVQNAVNYPQKISLEAKSDHVLGTCVFNILRAEFEVPVRFSTTSTDRYSRADIEQLLKK